LVSGHPDSSAQVFSAPPSNGGNAPRCSRPSSKSWMAGQAEQLSEATGCCSAVLTVTVTGLG